MVGIDSPRPMDRAGRENQGSTRSAVKGQVMCFGATRKGVARSRREVEILRHGRSGGREMDETSRSKPVVRILIGLIPQSALCKSGNLARPKCGNTSVP